MKTLVLIAICLLLVATMASAQDSASVGFNVGAPAMQGAYGTGYQPQQAQSTYRVPVQKVAMPRVLTGHEYAAIDSYVRNHSSRMSSYNTTSLGAALMFLVGIDQSHVPLTRKPNDYLADYQMYTQLLERTDFYANIPRQELPEFTCEGPLELEQIPQCKPVAAASCAGPSVGAFKFGKPAAKDEWSAWAIYQKRQHVVTPPKEDEECPGVNPPPEPNPGDTIGPGGQPWDPSPDDPTVADPVN